MQVRRYVMLGALAATLIIIVISGYFVYLLEEYKDDSRCPTLPPTKLIVERFPIGSFGV